MYLAFVAPGHTVIPPVGWGAVEVIIWDYYQCLTKMGYDVDIINTTSKSDIIEQLSNIKYDVIHIMYDDHIDIVDHLKTNAKILYTTHWAYLTNDKMLKSCGYFKNFRSLLSCNNKPYVFALSNAIKEVYVSNGYPSNLVIVHGNGAQMSQFQFALYPKFPNKSIYIGKIEERKKQYKYQCIDSLYFVGNVHDSRFDTTTRYLGPWSKKQLYEQLSHYGNLILLSDGEADPLVVKEALVAGLGVVVSEVASANLDYTKQFITVIPDAHLNDISYVTEAIIQNRNYAIKNRIEILQYSQKFDWFNIVKNYVKKIQEL